MTTYHIIGALPDAFDKRAHAIRLQLDFKDYADAWSIKLTSREARLFRRLGIEPIKAKN